MGELKATFSTALEVLQCSRTITSHDQSQCVLLPLSVCALGGPPPPPCSPPKWSHNPWGQTLAGGGPVCYFVQQLFDLAGGQWTKQSLNGEQISNWLLRKAALGQSTQ